MIKSCIILQEMANLLFIHSFWHRKPINIRSPRVVQITVSWLLLKMLKCPRRSFCKIRAHFLYWPNEKSIFPTDFEMKTRTYLILFASFFVSLISRNFWQPRIMFQCKLQTWSMLHKLHRYNYFLLRNWLRTRLIFPFNLKLQQYRIHTVQSFHCKKICFWSFRHWKTNTLF